MITIIVLWKQRVLITGCAGSSTTFLSVFTTFKLKAGINNLKEDEWKILPVFFL